MGVMQNQRKSAFAKEVFLSMISGRDVSGCYKQTVEDSIKIANYAIDRIEAYFGL